MQMHLLRCHELEACMHTLGKEPIIYVVCVAVLGVLAIVARHFTKGNGRMCTVVCLKAEASGAATVTQAEGRIAELST